MIKNLKTKAILILLLNFLASSLYADKIEVNLREFANIVASQNGVNILIQEAVEDEKTTFLIGDKNNNVYLPAFQKMLFLKGYNFKKTNDFYYIEKIPEKIIEEKKEELIKDEFHLIALKNDVFNDVENILKTYNLKYSYVSSTNSVSFSCPPDLCNYVKSSVKSLDVENKQIQFKITVLETNLNDIKDRGSNISSYMQTVPTLDADGKTLNQSYNYFLNLITMPYSASSNVLENSKSGFYGVLKYLNQNGFTEIKNSPVVTASSNKEVSFTSGKNVPFKVGTSSYASASTSSTSSYQYRDVGLKIVLKPIILENTINFDLLLTLEEIENSTTTDMLQTSKKELKSSYKLKKGEILVLSGINKETQLDSSYGVPVLKDIWFLGNFFKFESNTKTNSVITITIEVL